MDDALLSGYDIDAIDKQPVCLDGPRQHQQQDTNVVMHVVRIDGNQLRFLTHTDDELDRVDETQLGFTTTLSAGSDATVQTAIALQTPEASPQLQEASCYVCGARTSQLTVLLDASGGTTGGSLAVRLEDCVSPLQLDIAGDDAVCDVCTELIHQADHCYQQYLDAGQKIKDVLQLEDVVSPGDVPPSVPSSSRLEQPLPPRAASQPSGPSARFMRRAATKRRADDADWTPAAELTSSRAPRGRPSRAYPARDAPNGKLVKIELRSDGVPSTQEDEAEDSGEDVDVGGLQHSSDDEAGASCDSMPNVGGAEGAGDAAPAEGGGDDAEGKPPPELLHLNICPAAESTDAPADEQEERDRRTWQTVQRTNNGSYKCRRCGLVLTDQRVMEQHVLTHGDNPWCRLCRAEFDDKEQLAAHRVICSAHRKLPIPGTCSTCDRVVTDYRYHMKQHARLIQEGAVAENDVLSAEYDEAPARGSVTQWRSGGTCSICGLYVEERLRRHERTHNITHSCPICHRVFAREDVVKGHIRRVHMKERPHSCGQCGKTFVSVYSLQRHEMIHNNEYRYYCQECGDGFRQKQQLTLHMKHKHGVMDVVFEDIQVMPEAPIMDSMAVVTDANGQEFIVSTDRISTSAGEQTTSELPGHLATDAASADHSVFNSILAPHEQSLDAH